MFVTVGRSSRIPVNKISHLFSKRDSLVDSLWLSWRQPLICFLFSGEKIPTLTSHREGPFRSINFKISQNNHISPCFASYDLGSPPFVLDAPGRVGNLLAADLHRSIGLSAAPPSSWPGRELRKYHCLEVPEAELFGFQGAAPISDKSISEVFPFQE